jgi:hypothetical protein
MNMTLSQFLQHYLNPGEALVFFLITALVVSLAVVILSIAARRGADRYVEEDRPLYVQDRFRLLTEKFYELVFSGTAITLFVGVYFLIDFLGVSIISHDIWEQYSDFILLGFILLSVLINTFLDHVVVPLRFLKTEEFAAARLCGMLYMIILFIYIKFIYQDNNYDAIIMYYLTLIIGRFVYFDASLQGFLDSVRDAVAYLPLLGLGLVCTALLAWTGFGSGYLLKSNGVVFSLFIAHLFMTVVIFILFHTHVTRLLVQAPKKKNAREEDPKDEDDENW